MAIVKSYIGTTQKEAFDKVKADLGDEAIIINTRKIRKRKLFSFFAKPLVELTAILDETDEKPRDKKSSEDTYDSDELKKLISESVKNEKLSKLEKQMLQVTDAINMVYRDVNLIKNKELAHIPNELSEVHKLLIENGVTTENAARIISEAQALSDKENIDVNDGIKAIINNYLGEPSIIETKKGEKNTVLFIGPTGVGKTTTLAKIAAVFTLKYGAKVGLITEDTYRIGAVEQLKIYADILSLKLKVAYDASEISKLLDDMKDYDLVLIDTAGKSPLDKTYHENLKTLIKVTNTTEVHLLISSTTEYKTALDILNKYSFIENYKILFTKLDESGKWGNLLNIKMQSDKPLSYITNGQDVAEDILPANPDIIFNKLLEDGGEGNGSSAPAAANS